MSVMPFALEGFEMEPFTASSGKKCNVYRTGSGPAVIVMNVLTTAGVVE